MNELEKLQVCSRGSCLVGKEEVAWQEAGEEGKGQIMQDFIRHIRDFGIYLSQEKLKDFKQEKNDMINLHPSGSFSLLNGEWNAMGEKRRRNPEQLPLS